MPAPCSAAPGYLLTYLLVSDVGSACRVSALYHHLPAGSGRVDAGARDGRLCSGLRHTVDLRACSQPVSATQIFVCIVFNRRPGIRFIGTGDVIRQVPVPAIDRFVRYALAASWQREHAVYVLAAPRHRPENDHRVCRRIHRASFDIPSRSSMG
jgi:hypothetical protein